MSLYIDTSAFLKLFFQEPESARTIELVSAEPAITVSALTRIEALAQIRGREVGGLLTHAKAQERRRQLDVVVAARPFHLRACPAEVFQVAEQQIASSAAHCFTLDRLHLAAMQVFGLHRLLTNDDTQAAAARALGWEVLMPR